MAHEDERRFRARLPENDGGQVAAALGIRDEVGKTVRVVDGGEARPCGCHVQAGTPCRHLYANRKMILPGAIIVPSAGLRHVDARACTVTVGDYAVGRVLADGDDGHGSEEDGAHVAGRRTACSGRSTALCCAEWQPSSMPIPTARCRASSRSD